MSVWKLQRVVALLWMSLGLLYTIYGVDCYDVDALSKVAKAASGVYVTGSKKSIDKTLILATGNHGYLNHMGNFKCWLDRLGMKALVFSLDIDMHNAMQNINNNGVESLYSFLWSAGEGTVRTTNAGFGTKQFHVITTSKLEAALAVMKLGYNVFFVDTDVAIVRDPFPYLIWKNVDYVHTVNLVCPHSIHWDFWKGKDEGNTGVYWVRSTNHTMTLFDTVIKAAPSFPSLDDQNLLWRIIRSKEFADEKGIELIALPNCRDFDYTGPVRTPEKVSTVVSSPPPPKVDTAMDPSLYAGPFGEMVPYEKRKSIASKPFPIVQKNIGGGDDHARELVTCPLEACTFSSGSLRGVAFLMLENNLRVRNESSITVHANYLNGNAKKMEALKAHGFWLAQGGGTCAAFHGPKKCKDQPALCMPRGH